MESQFHHIYRTRKDHIVNVAKVICMGVILKGTSLKNVGKQEGNDGCVHNVQQSSSGTSHTGSIITKSTSRKNPTNAKSATRSSSTTPIIQNTRRNILNILSLRKYGMMICNFKYTYMFQILL